VVVLQDVAQAVNIGFFWKGRQLLKEA
jgi:hypothetical protein